MAAKKKKVVKRGVTITPGTPAEDPVLVLVQRSPRGVTSADVAKRIHCSERSARRDLARLFKAKKIMRTGEYVGAPPVFHYRYQPKKAKPIRDHYRD